MQQLMTTNVYSVRGRVLIAGTCLDSVWPEAFHKLSENMDNVYGLCLEEGHLNMAVTKIAAILGTGQVTELVFASVDRSPHCVQLHYIRHEIERTMPEHIPMSSYVVDRGEIVHVPVDAVELSKSLSALSRLDGMHDG